jgi:hypothetical protein
MSVERRTLIVLCEFHRIPLRRACGVIRMSSPASLEARSRLLCGADHLQVAEFLHGRFPPVIAHANATAAENDGNPYDVTIQLEQH